MFVEVIVVDSIDEELEFFVGCCGRFNLVDGDCITFSLVVDSSDKGIVHDRGIHIVLDVRAIKQRAS